MTATFRGIHEVQWSFGNPAVAVTFSFMIMVQISNPLIQCGLSSGQFKLIEHIKVNELGLNSV